MEIGAEMRAVPPLTMGVAGASRPFVRAMAALTWPALSALATTITGLEVSARSWASSTLVPLIESNSLV